MHHVINFGGNHIDLQWGQGGLTWQTHYEYVKSFLNSSLPPYSVDKF